MQRATDGIDRILVRVSVRKYVLCSTEERRSSHMDVREYSEERNFQSATVLKNNVREILRTKKMKLIRSMKNRTCSNCSPVLSAQL